MINRIRSIIEDRIMPQRGTVSVVIPTHYRNDALRTAIESVRSQTYAPIEIIVVDDSGERYAEPVAREYDVTYLAHEENAGANVARNTGIEVTEGEYVQLLDDDDQLLPTKIEKQVELLESNPSVGVVYCGIQQENGNLYLPVEENRGDVLEQALKFSELHPCQTTTMLIRGDLIRSLHPLGDWESADDIGLKIRAAERMEFDYIDEILVEKGNAGEHRVTKLEFSDDLFGMIEQFEYLYDQFDEQVRRDAVAAAYQSRGVRLLNGSRWSAEAVVCFGKALYYSRSLEPGLVGSFLSSIFGREMYRLSRRVYHLLSPSAAPTR
jgi:glycosyltransferase involved in cell wall biosynthesis